jgi:copper homeostasis protein CutC
MSAIKFDGDKPRMELLSRVALEGCARVLTFGAKKYADDNWRDGGFEWRRLIGAAMRHLTAIMDGEDVDPESGLPHVDHLACCVMFLSEHQKKNLGRDNRWKPNNTTNCNPVNLNVKSGSEEPTMQPPESVFAVRKRNC